MRNILFRAKKENKKWIYGYYYKIRNNVYILRGGIGRKPRIIKILQNTLGQYTGCKDIRGKKIYEGDIVITNEFGSVIGNHFDFSGFDTFIVMYDNGFCLQNGERKYSLENNISLEVHDNIHDNPKLANAILSLRWERCVHNIDI